MHTKRLGKTLALLATTAMLVTLFPSGIAFGSELTVHVTVDNPIALVNGSPTPLTQPPVIIGGRTLVPFRFIGEAFGANVQWDGATKKVTAILGSTTVILFLNSPTAFVDGTPMTLSVPPQLVNSSTMVPLRFLADAFGFVTEWIASARTAVVTGSSPAEGEGEPEGVEEEEESGVSDAPEDPTDGAAKLTVDGPAVDGELVTAGAYVYYYFQAEAGKKYTVTTQNLSSGCDTYTYLYNSTLVIVAENDNSGPGTYASSVTYTAPAAGKYYVGVRPQATGLQSGLGTFDVKVVKEASSVFVPIFPPIIIVPIVPPTTLTVNGPSASGNLSSETDSDWFQFSVGPDMFGFSRYYVIETFDLSAGCDTKIELFRSGESTAFATNDNAGYAKASQAAFWASDDYTVTAKVTCVGGATGTYAIRVTRSDAHFSMTMDSARVITPDTVGYYANLNASIPQCWYKFTTSPGTVYWILTDALTPPTAADPKSADTKLQMYTSTGSLIKTDNDSGPGRGSLMTISAASAATYYLKVTPSGNPYGTGYCTFRIRILTYNPQVLDY